MDPFDLSAEFQRALQHHQAGRLPQAEARYREILAHDPRCIEALHCLGNALTAQGRLDEALACYRQALLLNPNFAEGYCNLGSLFGRGGRFDEALLCFRQALVLQPDNAAAHQNLGSVLKDRGQLDAALSAYRHAIALVPDFAEAHNNLGNLFMERGQLDDALASYRTARELSPDRPDFQSNVILALQYCSRASSSQIENELHRWRQHHAHRGSARPPSHANDPSPERPLRIGYVSHDFRLHSVAFFLLPLLEAHDRGTVHVTCYSTNPGADEVTTQFQTCADTWFNLSGLSDADAAQRIRNDRIDLLVDLSGHFAGNRLPVFSYKPAPVQVSYLGYPATTGLDTVDYRLTDEWADPLPAPSEYYSEQLVRLPKTAWCFRPLSGSPPVSELPALHRDGLTFGCFNNFIKVTDETLGLWARILQRMPTARLLIKNQAIGTPSIVRRLQEFFARHEIARDRVEFIPHQASTLAHLQCYDRVDLALDTFPYHGTTTTCEALWMGVPVLTLAGNRHRSRVGVSLLTNVGLPEFVARTPDEYVDFAVAVAQDRPRLAALRRALRDRMQQSPLMDAQGFARAVECTYRTLWHRWCAQSATVTRLPR